MTSKVHIICGGTGAGKSTFCKKLAGDIDGVHFAIDDWMANLFWMDSPQPIEFEWTMERIGRCETQIWEQAVALAKVGIPIIFDLGFTKAEHRKKFADLAKEAELDVVLHLVDAPTEVRWKRVHSRNEYKGETYAMNVTREMFNFMEEQWEQPNAAEMKALNGVKI